MENHLDQRMSSGQWPRKKRVRLNVRYLVRVLTWGAAFIKPYIVSILPAGAVPVPSTESSSGSVNTAQSFNPTPLIQIRSSLSFLPVQTLSFPFVNSSGSSLSLSTTLSVTQNAVVRLLTPSSNLKSRLFMVTTPIDRTLATSEGSTIWQTSMKTWAEQLDELVLTEQYYDALGLLDVIDEAMLSDKVHHSSS